MQVRPVHKNTIDKERFSKVILDLLCKSGLTEVALAKELDVSRNMIAHYREAVCAPSMTVIRVLHEKFHLSYSQIFGEEEINDTVIKYSLLPEDEQKLIADLIEKLSAKEKQ